MYLLDNLRKLLFLLIIGLTTTAFSQNEANNDFPISGLMKVQKNENNEPKRYNYIEFKDDTYALMLDDRQLYVFQSIAKINDEYVLKQLTFGEKVLDENSDPTNMRLRIREIASNTYELSFIYSNRTERIILHKQ